MVLQKRQRRCRLINPRTIRRMIAPMVAAAIAAPIPAPIRMPSLGSSQNPISAPITPTPILPMRPKPQPLTMRPASQPAINPTSRMTSRLSPDIDLSVMTIDRNARRRAVTLSLDALIYSWTKTLTLAHRPESSRRTNATLLRTVSPGIDPGLDELTQSSLRSRRRSAAATWIPAPGDEIVVRNVLMQKLEVATAVALGILQ